ncbi:MAG: 4Fe-4S binding protein [Pontiellaceae bacterium]|nr:4Fe-4S binding protein [Pontiellaceae bacterium]MBN2784948.1 4Fe-4S binding protein [Pontiellaceae bacterium]
MAKYTKRRRIIQGLSLLVLASIPLRLLCFDFETDSIRAYGAEFGLSTMFYPLFAIVGLLLYVVILSMKKGRIFCSHMCPMHMFLETVNSSGNRNSGRRPLLVWGLAIVLSLFLAEVILSFFLPISRQVVLVGEGHRALIGIGAAIFLGLLGLFVHYQESFCKRGCPYALIQMLLQSDRTRYMEFSNPEKTCTNCRGCDNVCPFNLRARFESRGTDCTNCNLCAEACEVELGAGNTLFHLIDAQSVEDSVFR